MAIVHQRDAFAGIRGGVAQGKLRTAYGIALYADAKDLAFHAGLDLGQDGRLFQKGLQHSGTSAKPMGSLASGQPFQLALQSLLPVIGCGQLALRNILFVSQLFQFFAYGQFLLSDNGQNKYLHCGNLQ